VLRATAAALQEIAREPPAPWPGELRHAAVIGEILDALPALIRIRDSSGRCVFANAAVAEFYGARKGELVGRAPASSEKWGADDPVEAPGERHAADSITRRGLTLRDARGRMRELDVVRRPLRDVHGVPAWMLEVATEPGAAARRPRETREADAEAREISERERARIGHDLHDGLGQELTGASLLLKALEDAAERDAPALQPRVAALRELIEQCLETTRALARGLSPVHLDGDELPAALGELAASSTEIYGVPVRFASDLEAPLAAIDGAIDLYRIAQEAVRNAARHSGAQRIGIDLTVTHEHLTLVVEDDGGGFDEQRATYGLGLKIMRYRASMVGASLHIGAREGGGTAVRCTLRIGAHGAH